MADGLVYSDISALSPGERYQRADLMPSREIQALLQGADMVVHFCAGGDEAPFEAILGPNIIGAYNIWKAARQNRRAGRSMQARSLRKGCIPRRRQLAAIWPAHARLKPS